MTIKDQEKMPPFVRLLLRAVAIPPLYFAGRGVAGIPKILQPYLGELGKPDRSQMDSRDPPIIGRGWDLCADLMLSVLTKDFRSKLFF